MDLFVGRTPVSERFQKAGNSEDSHVALQGAVGVGSTGLVNFIEQQVAEDGPPS